MFRDDGGFHRVVGNIKIIVSTSTYRQVPSQFIEVLLKFSQFGFSNLVQLFIQLVDLALSRHLERGNYKFDACEFVVK